MKKLYIEPTSKCNFQCKMCFRNSWFDEAFVEMEYDVFLSLINHVPDTVETIFFGGMGEPLFHKDILKMIRVCKEKNYQVELLTNGSLLSEQMCDDLIVCKLDKLWVSLDEFHVNGDKTEKELSVEELGHPNMDMVLKNIKRLNFMKYRKKSGMKLGIALVVSKDNVELLQDLPLLIDKYSINDVNISNMYPSTMADMEKVLYERIIDLSVGSDIFGAMRAKVNLPYMDMQSPEVVSGITGMFQKMNFNLSVGNIPVPRRSQYCRFVEEGMCFVRSDGDVSPCMALLHNGTTVVMETERTVYHHSFGNVKEQGLDAIWASEEYESFRSRVKKFEFSPCMNCGHCTYPETNEEDCFGNEKPTCGACLWSEGILSCP